MRTRERHNVFLGTANRLLDINSKSITQDRDTTMRN
jgi:hypothetical protein